MDQSIRKVAAQLCCDLSANRHNLFITSGAAINDHQGQLKFILIIATSDTGTNATIIDFNPEWDVNRKDYLLKIIKNTFGTKLEEKQLKAQDFQYFLAVDKNIETPSIIIDELKSFQTGLNEYGVHVIKLLNETVDSKLVAIIGNFMALNSNDQIAENLLDLTVTIEGKKILMKDALMITSNSPIKSIYVQPQCLRSLSYDALTRTEKDVGLFLVRNDLSKRLMFPKVRPNGTVETVAEVTETTRFLISESIAFEEVSHLRDNVHEVLFECDFEVLNWIRSTQNPSILREFLCSYKVVGVGEPLKQPITIVHGMGKTHFCNALKHKIVNEDNSKFVANWKGLDLEPYFSDVDVNLENKEEIILKLIQMNTDFEINLFKKLNKLFNKFNVTIDDFEKMSTDNQTKLMEFLKIAKQLKFISIWITAQDKSLLQLEQSLAIFAHKIPDFTYPQMKNLIKNLSPNISDENCDKLCKKIESDNWNEEFDPFFIKLCVEYYQQKGLEVSYYMTFVLNFYTMAKRDKFLFEVDGNYTTLENAIEDMIFYAKGDYDSLKPISKALFNAMFGSDQLHRIVEFKAATHLVDNVYKMNPEMIGSKALANIMLWFDKICFEKCPAASMTINNPDYNKRYDGDFELEQDQFGRNPLHVARSYGRYVLNANFYSVNEKDKLFSWTPVRCAEERSNWLMVEELLKTGASTDDLEKLKKMSTEEIDKIKMDFIRFVKLGTYIFSQRFDFTITHEILLQIFEERYPDEIAMKVLNLAHEQQLVNQFQYKNELHSSALHIAAGHTKDVKIIEFLIEKLNFDVNEMNWHKRTPLSFTESVDVAKCLIKYGADPDYCDVTWYERHMFLNACASGNIKMMSFYLDELKTDIHRLDADGCNAMHFACQSLKLEAVKLLFKHGFKDLDKKSIKSNETPMMMVIQQKEAIDIVKFLMEQGADVTAKTIKGETILDRILMIDGSQDLCSTLLKMGVEVNPIFIVCSDFDRIKEIDLISPINWNTDERDSHDLGCLHLTLLNSQSMEMFEYIAKKCDIDQKAADGSTPLHMALQVSTPLEDVKKIINLGADINKTDNTGKTSLHYAAQSYSLEKLKFFIEEGLDVNAKDNLGRSTVHHFYSSYEKECAEYLLQCGMDANACDNNGRTALHEIMIEKPWDYQWAVINAMDGLKVDPTIRDNRNSLAIHYLVKGEGSRGFKPLRVYAERHPIDFDAKDCDGKSVLDLTENVVLKNFLLEIKSKQ